MLKVKFSFPYPEWNILRQTSASGGVWGDCRFFVNEDVDQCDYWFVFNYLSKDVEQVRCPRERVVLLTGEPYVIQRYDPEFVRQFGQVITCQREIRHPRVTYHHQGHPWFVGARFRDGRYDRFTKSYDELRETLVVAKTKSISVVTSNKRFTDGHQRRYDFVMALKEYFGDAIDLFGRGVRDFEDKWDVLADYKYSIAIENYVCDDWMTEKLYDCYLAHTFPFYYGCQNVAKYFDDRALVRIDLESLDESKRTIEHVLKSTSHYEEHLDDLIRAKMHYLDNLNVFPLMASFVSTSASSASGAETVTLQNDYRAKISFAEKVVSKLASICRRFVR